ncbi:MAG TPA: MerR family DNA-binding protein [Caulobacteraceae bacterium]|jgi:MerR family mercuric resistance operon transcriptional regulator
MTDMTIAALARSGDVGVETVRYYQRRGLMREPRRPEGPGLGGGVRRYGEDDVRRLRFIKSAQTAGFTLEEIGELLALDSTDERPRARDMARSRIAALDAKIAELTAASMALSRLADECSSSEKGPCPIISAFEPLVQQYGDSIPNPPE